MSNFPCSLTRNITSHSMKNLAFHGLLRWKMIILPLLTTSLIHFFWLGECTLLNLRVKGLNQSLKFSKARATIFKRKTNSPFLVTLCYAGHASHPCHARCLYLNLAKNISVTLPDNPETDFFLSHRSRHRRQHGAVLGLQPADRLWVHWPDRRRDSHLLEERCAARTHDTRAVAVNRGLNPTWVAMTTNGWVTMENRPRTGL